MPIYVLSGINCNGGESRTVMEADNSQEAEQRFLEMGFHSVKVENHKERKLGDILQTPTLKQQSGFYEFLIGVLVGIPCGAILVGLIRFVLTIVLN